MLWSRSASRPAATPISVATSAAKAADSRISAVWLVMAGPPGTLVVQVAMNLAQAVFAAVQVDENEHR